ncbi:MAG: 5-deoxy-glucuronate isomerase [Thermomicrobiales bacterium]|nr:5-deoxy-glucuronate isomerase [Thermomicrobiales bacterium]
MAITVPPHELLLHSADLDGGSGTLIAVDPERAGWAYCSLTVQRHDPGASWSAAAGDDEVALVPLGGICTIESGGQTWRIGERANVFAGPPWALYLGRGARYEVRAETPLELAVCGARATRTLEPVLIRPEDVTVEIRGAGNAARQINHIIKPGFPADKLLVVEVFTPSGNWSSFPPHKHDISDLPREADLEEIYYYRIDPPDGFALQRLYTHDGAVDAAYVIHDGDLLLVPEGYHAFAVAHGYTGYYLNVLAGDEPERTMQPSDDPRYAWVRETWTDAMNAGLRGFRDVAERVNGAAGRREP